MQQQTKLIFLFMFLWLVNKAQGQGSGKRAENTILKLDNEDSYKPSQIRYFERKGYNVENYQGNNSKIDENLNGALLNRSNSNMLIGVGSFFAIFGAHRLIFSGLLEKKDNIRRVKRVGTTMLVLSGISFTTSIVLKSSSKKKIYQAEKLRAEGFELID